MLEDLQCAINGKNSPSAKYQLKQFEKDSKSLSKKHIDEDPEFVKRIHDEYVDIIRRNESLIEYIRESGGNPNDEKRLSKLVTEMKNNVSSDEKFINVLIDREAILKYNEFVDAYNSDLKLRIMFLRDMKKFKESKKSIEPYLVKESGDFLSDLIVKSHNKCYEEYVKKESEMVNIIHEYFNDILDHSFYTEDDIDDITNEAYAYFVIEDLEKEKHDDVDVRTFLENKLLESINAKNVAEEIPYSTASSGHHYVNIDESQINPFALFDKLPINDYTVKRYRDKTNDMALGLKHLHLNDNTRGFMWLNHNDDVVGYVAVDRPNITMIELSPKYQHKGLGRALLNFATDYLGGRRIAVSKRNENAYNMLNHCGWCKYDETPNMNMMMICEDMENQSNNDIDNTDMHQSNPSDGIYLRPAADEDIPNMFEWEMDSLDPEFRDDPKVIEDFKKDAAESVWKTRMIMDNDQTIGMLTAYDVDGYWYIGEIYLIESYRGKGIGTKILKDEISQHDKLSLDVSKKNPKAIELYKSLGFEVVNENDYGYYMTLEKNNKESDLNEFK